MIFVILGTKAQLIKMAPVMKCLQEQNIPYRFIHTGQHKETMDDMYMDFSIKKPDLFLYDGPDIVSISQVISWFVKILYSSLFKRKTIFGKSKPGIVLVHGDTFSTLLGALMGRVAGHKVGHVESGLRSFNLLKPFPEEITRIIVFRLSHLLFCPGDWAVRNVSKFNNKKIVNTGHNTMADTIRMSLKKNEQGTLKERIEKIGLVSLHRYENIFVRRQLVLIIDFLEIIASKHKLNFVLHPPTKKQLIKYGLYGQIMGNPMINCIDRMNHSEFLELLIDAKFVITDGGSLQEETSFIGKPCLLFREGTERLDGLGENVVLSKFDKTIIDDFIKSYDKYERVAHYPEISASSIIVQELKGG